MGAYEYTPEATVVYISPVVLIKQGLGSTLQESFHAENRSTGLVHTIFLSSLVTRVADSSLISCFD